MVKVKICGLSRKEDMETVNRLTPDYIGFVFTTSKRQVSVQQARVLKNSLKPQIKVVGVFVNANVMDICEIVRQGIIDCVQLHGDESAAYIQALRAQVSAPIIKAIRVRDVSSLENLEKYACDYFLLDTYNATQYGGSGKCLDEDFLEHIKLPKPYFIAGGLNPDNVQKIIRKVHPYGVDVSSGVESDGKKDAKKIAAFLSTTFHEGVEKNG